MKALVIESGRLRYRPLTLGDVDEMHRLWIDPGVRKYLWDDRVISAEEAREAGEASVSLYQDKGFGLWGISFRDTVKLIGFCGYWFFHDPPELQLLYGIAPDYWGKGLATEAAQTMIRYGFERLSLDQIAASTDAPNQASVRVMEKAGMKFDKRIEKNGLDTIYYLIRREEWHPDRSPDTVYLTIG
ncbi:MAG TPA: GNAT family N-acetyltransferase [Blastocatellia bacterium]|nr:GNAT family N-acetyltransferase [Blastocatellia bacterium]